MILAICMLSSTLMPSNRLTFWITSEIYEIIVSFYVNLVVNLRYSM